MVTAGESMKKWVIILVIIFILPIIGFFVYSLFPSRRIDKEFVLRDINTMQDMLIKGRIDTFKDISKEAFFEGFAQIRFKLPDKFHKMDFFLTVQPFLSKFEDPYTSLLFDVPEYLPILPFKARFFGDRLFVIESIDDRIKPEDEIVEFDGMNMKELKNFLRNLVAADNQALAEKRIERIFSYLPFILRKGGFILKLSNGQKLRVKPVTLRTYRKTIKQIKGGEKSFEYTERNGVGILKLNTFNIYGQEIYDFDDLLDELHEKNLRGLVIDVRDCEGGDFRTAKKLLLRIAKEATELILFRRVRISEYSTGKKNVRVEDQTDEFRIKLEKVKTFRFKTVVLVDKATSNQALDFAYLAKKLGAAVAGETPDQPLGHYIFPIGKYLPGAGYYFMTPSAKWLLSGKLEVDFPIKISLRDRLNWLTGRSDRMLESLLKEAFDVAY